MSKMHENELEINEGLVHRLLKSQCAQWANMSLKPILSSGTDNALFRLGDEYIVRLPRVEWVPEGNNINIDKEYEWLPKLAQFLKVPISQPIFKGHRHDDYPWSWLVTKWNEGHTPHFENESEFEYLAKDLAHFLNDLHKINLPDGPTSRRGVSLTQVDEETRKAISELAGEFDAQSLGLLWQRLSNIALWTKAPVWVHGDFLQGNILIQNNRLSAVIDFSDVGRGDPACDLIIAWSLLKPRSREIFRKNLENIDEDTWERGRGWALSIALIMLPYYKNSNPILATLARRMIQSVLEENS